MSAFTLAKSAYNAFNREKPHSSISAWVDILTSSSYEEEAYDGLWRRARPTDPKVKRKLMSVLAAWNSQFKDDPTMSLVAGLYKQCKPLEAPGRARTMDAPIRARTQDAVALDVSGIDYDAEHNERKRERKEEEKRKAREAKEAKESEKLKLIKQREEARRRKSAQGKTNRKPFNFEQARYHLCGARFLADLVTVGEASGFEHYRQCITSLKQSGQCHHENEDMIGALIESNERIIAALDMYDTLSKPRVTEQDVEDVQEGLAKAHIHDSELGKLQQKQRAAVQRSISRGTLPYAHDDSHLHPDLQDLSFGPLGAEQRDLPPPMRPTTSRYSSEDDVRHGSLSDFSDYQSSDEEAHNQASSSGIQSRKKYVTVSDDDEVDVRKDPKRGLLEEEDPFADPFGDP
ncbi:hypothetical protein EUX98_g8090 [Antrodiella citrinella]|uniref:VHS domain-containing protein n=1 Tax=Antrodiella citrinella TaxID=2447956 RepID=A0A4S4MC77_9APHY|nr:hypothetical protein EUX98_g8090 [Antrodiella citrinella]